MELDRKTLLKLALTTWIYLTTENFFLFQQCETAIDIARRKQNCSIVELLQPKVNVDNLLCGALVK